MSTRTTWPASGSPRGAAANVGALHVADVIAEGCRACVTYTVDTPNGPIACCDRLVIQGGRIASVHAHYDSRDLPHFERY